MWHLLLPICLTLKEVHCGCRGDLIRTAPETQWNCLVSPKHRRRSCLMMLVTACPCCNSAGSWRWKLEVFRGNGPMTSFELTAPCLAQDFSKRFQKGRLYGLSTTHALTRPSLRPRIGEAVNFFLSTTPRRLPNAVLSMLQATRSWEKFSPTHQRPSCRDRRTIAFNVTLGLTSPNCWVKGNLLVTNGIYRSYLEDHPIRSGECLPVTMGWSFKWDVFTEKPWAILGIGL